MTRTFALLLLCTAVFAQEQKTPERRVQGNVLASDTSPKVRIEVPASAKYLGAERWDLYGVADCEIHVWVEAGEDKVLKRLYWLQFEAYLPSKPDSRYNYPFTKTTRLGGLDFDTRTRVAASAGTPRPGSDSAHVIDMVKAAGYTLPAEFLSVRLVHLPDETRRSELMIMYVEDLKPTGFTVADLQQNGKSSAELPKLEQALMERAVQNLKITKVSAP
jgi:hypothetical protein